MTASPPAASPTATPAAPAGYKIVVIADPPAQVTVPDDWQSFQQGDIGSPAYLAAQQHAYVPVSDTDQASFAAVFFLADRSHLSLTRVAGDEAQVRMLALAFSKAIEDSTQANELRKSGVQFDDGPGYRIQYTAPASVSDPRVVASDVVFFPAGGSAYRMTLTGADPISPAVGDAALAAAHSVARAP